MILDKARIKLRDLTEQTQTWIVNKYEATGDVFSKASPFGQILSTFNNYTSLIFYYIEDAISEMNIFNASRQKTIYGWARLTGHNPTRAISAKGTLSISLNNNTSDLIASKIIIPNRIKIKCETNNLFYFLEFNNALGNLTLNLNDKTEHYVRIIEGEMEEQTATGDGKPLQSYNFRSNQPIENDIVNIFINGDQLEVVDSLYDMVKDGKQVMVKTAISNGIDVIFGNEDYGFIPQDGAVIKVSYVKTAGFAGNLFSKNGDIKFKFNEEGITDSGESVNLNEYLNVKIEKPIILGADPESLELTRILAPKNSRSNVLANPDNYIHLLSRFNYSYIDAYNTIDDDYIDDNNIVYLYILPDVTKRLESNNDYFTTDINNFYLDESEKEALTDFINRSGRQIISTELSIVDPILTKYVCNVHLRIFDTYDVQQIKSDIIEIVSNYMLKIKRKSRLPKSDLIALIEDVNGVDSVNVSFVSEANEDAIINGYYYKNVVTTDKIRGLKVSTKVKVTVEPGTDPRLGLDDFGDIKIGLHELPIMRGGFTDRNSNYYEDGLNDILFSSVNIMINEVIVQDLASKKMMMEKKNMKNGK